MGIVNVIVIVESVQSLATTKSDSLKEFHIPSIAAVSAALGRPYSCSPGAAADMTQHQVSSFYSSCIVTPCEKSRVKFICSGKTIETTSS